MKESIFKCFGISKNDVTTALQTVVQNPNGVSYSISGTGLLVDISLKADDNNMYIYEWTHEIFEKLSPFIYAETDLSLEQAAFELLKLNKLTISTAESITGGQIVSSLIKKNVGASSVVLEGLATYSNDAKMGRLGVSKRTLDLHTSVSLQTTHEMAQRLLETSNCDIAIATTGYASSTKLTEDAGLVYIAIGTRKAIDVYKNKFVGTREEVIETASNAALFYLIKKLRKNDFHFSENEV